jgi:aldehyde dehydrogenase (NAD(P)+)
LLIWQCLGKTYHEALGNDLEEAISTFRHYSGWSDKIFSQTISVPKKFVYTIRQPLGVVAQIIPWNYPLSMASWKLGPALACGNTVVLKPAEQTPLSVLILGKMIEKAGFPSGVVNIVNGVGRETGSALVKHPLVAKVAFTGSTQTGSQIIKAASATLKNITLETGGRSPLLIFDDADLEQAVKWSHFGIMSHQGQICTATSRILVQKGINGDFIRRYVKETERKVVGDQWNSEAFQGPQVSKQQYDRVLSPIDAGVASGARLATSGKKITSINDGKGYFIQPTVFTDVTPDMSIWREEIFGPVVAIRVFETEDDAIRKANETVYGLGSAVFTTSLECALHVSAEIESGTVWVNSSLDCDPIVLFGGYKQSGIGRELGEAGLEAYTQIKAVHVNMGNRL